MRLTFSILLVTAIAFFGTSCVDSKPIHYYTIGTPSAPVAASAPAGPTILVTAVSASTALEDGRIRYRTGTNEVGAYQLHRWMERPGTMVAISLVHALRASGKYRVHESSSSATGDYLLRGKLYEFGEVDSQSIQTRISLQLELVDLKTKRGVWDRLVERDEPVDGKKMSDVVQSLDRNLQAAATEIALEIDKFLTANHADAGGR